MGSTKSRVSCPHPPLSPNTFQDGAHPAPEAYSEAELGVHVHFVQYVHLEKTESVSQLPSLTHTAHRHPSAHLLAYRDPEIHGCPSEWHDPTS